MARRLLKDSLIIIGGTLFLLLLCATVGITNSTPPSTSTANAAQDGEGATEDEEWSSDRVPQSREENAAHHFLEP